MSCQLNSIVPGSATAVDFQKLGNQRPKANSPTIKKEITLFVRSKDRIISVPEIN